MSHLAQFTEKHSRKKGQLFAAETEWVFSCQVLSSRPAADFLRGPGMLILAINVRGVEKYRKEEEKSAK